ncbi:MAG: hypothetical protein PVJ55_01775 [Anaerolineae bacterium]|jgi:cell division septum initiation protein DivIVA
MDILHLIDRLEEIIKEGWRLPFTDQRVVDEERLWPLLDQMRISIPDEMRKAERILREKERTKAQATEEAERIIELARQEAAELAASHSVARTAEDEAAEIRERARREARKIVAGADEYAFDVLCDLEQDLKRALTVIENGIRAVETRQARREAGSSPRPAESESQSQGEAVPNEETTKP